MPKYEGVYEDGKGGWYFKISLGRDPLTGQRTQVTKRGFRSAGEAARARKAVLEQGRTTPSTLMPTTLTVNDLLDEYLDGIDADAKLAPKTRFDYRKNAESYIRPWLGSKRVRDLTPEMILTWQRHLAQRGGAKAGKPLTPNTVRNARAPLAAALKFAVAQGVIPASPLANVARPHSGRLIPKHWSPDEARRFLRSQENERLYPVWAFLLGCGLRIGELVRLRWANVDLDRELVRVVEFVSTLGWEVVAAPGKSDTAIRTVDLDPGLVRVLQRQREMQRFEARAPGYEPSEYVFTKPAGGPYHPQTLSKSLAHKAQRAGLPRLTAHGLRHTSATLMLDNGVPPKVAAERLGHADPTLFTNLYSHVTPSMQKDAATRIGAALFAEPPG